MTSERQRTIPMLCAVIVLATLVVHLPGMVRGLYDPDEAAIGALAITARDGGDLYVDAIDRKPPIPALLYEASFRITDSTDLRLLRFVTALALAGAAMVLAVDARRRWGEKAGWWAAGLTTLGVVGFFPVDAQAANFAHIALLPGAVAVVASRWERRWAPSLTGVALGLAILSRQSWLVGVVPSVVGVTVTARGWKRRVEALGGFGFALASTVASAGLVAPFDRFWHWTFTSNGGFVSSGAPVMPTIGKFLSAALAFGVLHLALVAGVAVAARHHLDDAVAWWRSRNVNGQRSLQRSRRDDSDRVHQPPASVADLVMWLWVATGCTAIVAGFRFFGHYWLQVVPPLVVLASPVIARASDEVRRRAITAVAVPALLAFVAAWIPWVFRELPDPAPLAAAAREHTAPGERVWIWGNFPELLLEADRPIGGALVHSDFVTGRSGGRPTGPATVEDATPGALEAMLASLRANPPAMVVDTSTSGLRGYDNYPIADFPELDAYLESRYEPLGTVDGMTIWLPIDR